MQPESFLVLGICSSSEMVQNKTVALLIVLHTVLLLTSGLETARFVPRLKTLTHTQGRRSAERKGQLLMEPRCRKVRFLVPFGEGGSVIPTCQYNFSMSL